MIDSKEFEDFIDGRIEAAFRAVDKDRRTKRELKKIDLYSGKLKNILQKNQYSLLIDALDCQSRIIYIKAVACYKQGFNDALNLMRGI